MNSWSVRRKRLIFSIILFFLIILVGVPAFFLLYRAPTCFDGKQNGDETGIDCGGSCELLCSVESLPLLARGDPRIVSFSDDVFAVVAVFDNPNVGAEVRRAEYSIRLFEQDGSVPIKTFEGFVYIPKNSSFVVFEGPFNLSSRPARAVLEWKRDSLVWMRNPTPIPNIVLRDEVLSREETSPRLDVILQNTSLEEIRNIELTALVFDENSNIIASSKTFVDRVASGDSVPAVFIWPRPFEGAVVGTNIITRILPDRSYLR